MSAKTKTRNGYKSKSKKNNKQGNIPQEGPTQPINWHDNAVVTDIHVPWLYEAHSVLLLVIVLVVIFYCAFTMEGSLQLGIKLVIFLFMAIGCLVFPAGPFERPHPIFWRFIFSISVLYACFLLLLLSQTPDGARALLRKLFNDESLGYPLPERSYAVDCSFQFDVIWSCCDRFILAHFLGWAVKSAVVRDRALCWVLSVLWEVVELATKYFIPNFAECWWDQLILDVLLCNGLGIEAGLLFARIWYNDDERRYRRDWFGDYHFGSVCLKFKRLFIQLTPTTLTPMYWRPWSSLTRFFQIQLFIICAVFLDLNAFLLKLFLYIPTEHPLNILRLVLFLFFLTVSCKQYYLYLTNEKCRKIGSQVWMFFVILVMELGLAFKCAPSPFPEMPYINKVCFGIGGIAYLGFTYVMFRDLKHVKAD